MSMLRRCRLRVFRRRSRSQLRAQIAELETQLDRAFGEIRAMRDWLTSWLESRADTYAIHAVTLDQHGAVHQARERRLIADELRDLTLDLEPEADDETLPRPPSCLRSPSSRAR